MRKIQSLLYESSMYVVVILKENGVYLYIVKTRKKRYLLLFI
jgi:hypothetical protein